MAIFVWSKVADKQGAELFETVLVILVPLKKLVIASDQLLVLTFHDLQLFLHGVLFLAEFSHFFGECSKLLLPHHLLILSSQFLQFLFLLPVHFRLGPFDLPPQVFPVPQEKLVMVLEQVIPTMCRAERVVVHSIFLFKTVLVELSNETSAVSVPEVLGNDEVCEPLR